REFLRSTRDAWREAQRSPERAGFRLPIVLAGQGTVGLPTASPVEASAITRGGPVLGFTHRVTLLSSSRFSGPATMRIESPERLSTDDELAKRNTTPGSIVVSCSAQHLGCVLLMIQCSSSLWSGLDCPPRRRCAALCRGFR